MKLSRSIATTFAFVVAIIYPAGPSIESVHAWRVDVIGFDAHAKTSGDGPDALARLAILNRTIIHVRENYVEPNRINPVRMTLAALEYVQSQVDELIIDRGLVSDALPKVVTVRLGDQSKTFRIDDVQNLWTLSFKLKDVFRFIHAHRPQGLKSRDVEYAAINGLLSTLDPHSRLLKPEDYREMKLSTQGKFGGLGIVINVQDGVLTVVRPIEDTPADRAGIQAGDKVVQIGLDSTVNMTLDEAVDLLRGEPNTRVAIWVERKGWTTPRRYLLRRANVKVKSIVSRLLKDRVGWVKIHNFQSTTTSELSRTLDKLKRRAGRRLNGMILDLRGNPGGLLDQAVKVADLFVPSGPLVTTVGHGEKMREPKMATRTNTNTRLPIVVLIDGSSASASEIVAGALKNHNRALVVGQRSFGKGSVQVIYDNRDESALKLTIAQYLTPGDISIQSVGIVPDIQVRGRYIDRDKAIVDLFDGPRRGEDSLKKHLDRSTGDQTPIVKPQLILDYLRETGLEEKIQRNPNRLHMDFEVRLAREILKSAKTPYREDMLKVAQPVIESWQEKTNSRLVAELAELDVDWQPSAQSKLNVKPSGVVSFTSNFSDKPVTAGDRARLTIKVTNQGKAPYHRLYGISRSDNEQFDNHEFLFGRIEPGESKEWTVTMPIADDTLSQSVSMSVDFQSSGARPPKALRFPVHVASLDAPQFGLVYRIDDSKTGNGDGLIQLQEDVELVLTAQNHGRGDGKALIATLRAAPDAPKRRLFIRRGRIKSDPISVGDTKEFRFKFRIKGNQSTEIPLRVGVGDPKIGSFSIRRLTLRPVGPMKRLSSQDLTLRPAAGASIQLYAQPNKDASIVAWVPGVTVGRPGIMGWYRISLDDGTYGWADSGSLSRVDRSSSTTSARRVQIPAPIRFKIENEQSLRTTKNSAVRITGQISSDGPLKDLRVYVNNRKTYFRSASQSDSLSRLDFTVTTPLKEGLNRIDFVARSEHNPGQRHTIVIEREK